MSDVRCQLDVAICSRLDTIGGPVCWERPHQGSITACHRSRTQLLNIRGALIASIEADGYKNIVAIWTRQLWEVTQGSNVIQLQISEVKKLDGGYLFYITPAVLEESL